MNYLAHLHLADHGEDALLGAMLGDFVVGSDLSAWAPDVQREIRVHRRIDSYTDAHPELRALKSRFPQGQRRYAGIALDVYADHLLARDWPQYATEPLADFSQRVYALLLRRRSELPPRLQGLVPLMAAGDWLGSYRLRDSVDLAVARIARRLSRDGEPLIACLSTLREHEAETEARIARFFPQLQRFAADCRASLT